LEEGKEEEEEAEVSTGSTDMSSTAFTTSFEGVPGRSSFMVPRGSVQKAGSTQMKLLLCLILCERLDVLLQKTSRVRMVQDQRPKVPDHKSLESLAARLLRGMADDYLSKNSQIHGSRSQVSLDPVQDSAINPIISDHRSRLMRSILLDDQGRFASRLVH
jgi:hypothetical protein